MIRADVIFPSNDGFSSYWPAIFDSKFVLIHSYFIVVIFVFILLFKMCCICSLSWGMNFVCNFRDNGGYWNLWYFLENLLLIVFDVCSLRALLEFFFSLRSTREIDSSYWSRYKGYVKWIRLLDEMHRHFFIFFGWNQSKGGYWLNETSGKISGQTAYAAVGRELVRISPRL